MASLCLSLLPCSMIFFVCLVCSTLCQSLASINSLNPFHLLKKTGMPIPDFLDNPFVSLQKMQSDKFKNIKNMRNINKKKLKISDNNDNNDIDL